MIQERQSWNTTSLPFFHTSDPTSTPTMATSEISDPSSNTVTQISLAVASETIIISAISPYQASLLSSLASIYLPTISQPPSLATATPAQQTQDEVSSTLAFSPPGPVIIPSRLTTATGTLSSQATISQATATTMQQSPQSEMSQPPRSMVGQQSQSPGSQSSPATTSQQSFMTLPSISYVTASTLSSSIPSLSTSTSNPSTQSTHTSSSSSLTTTSSSTFSKISAASATTTPGAMNLQHKSTLSGGAIAGITISAAAVALLLSALLFLCFRRNNKKPPSIYPQEAYLYDPPVTPPLASSVYGPQPPTPEPAMQQHSRYEPLSSFAASPPRPNGAASPPNRSGTPELWDQEAIMYGTPQGSPVPNRGTWPTGARGDRRSGYRPLLSQRASQMPTLYENHHAGVGRDDDPNNPFRDNA